MNNFLFKKLEMSDEQLNKIVTELRNYVSSLIISEENAFSRINYVTLLAQCPELSAFLNSAGLVTTVAGIIRSHPSQVASNPHIDSFPQELAINFPVQDCENSTTKFYQPYTNDGSPPTLVCRQHPNGIEYYHYVDVNWRLLGSITLSGPTLLNIKVPHKVEHYGQLTRISLSLRFKQDPWHLI